MPLLSNSRQQIMISDTMRVIFLRANRGRKYGCLIFSLVPPSLRRIHIARTLCELTTAVSSTALLPPLPEHRHQLHQENGIFDNSTLRMRIHDGRHPCQHEYHHLLLVLMGTRSCELDVLFKLPRDRTCRPLIVYLLILD